MGTPTQTLLREHEKVTAQILDTGEIDLLGVSAKPRESVDDVFGSDAQAAADREAMIAACRQALGYEDTTPLTIETQEFLEERLREHLHLSAEALEAEKHLKHLQTQLKSWDYLWASACETYFLANLPEKGKTLSTKYGQISARTQPASIALDPNDKEETALQAYLADRLKNTHGASALFGIKEVQKTTYTRNLDAIKKHIMEHHEVALMQWKAADPKTRGPQPQPQTWPGMVYKPKHEVFSVKHKGIE